MASSTTLEKLKEQFARDRERIVADYFKFLRFPSISSEPEYQREVENCFQWLQQYLESMGLRTERWDTPRHPVLFAEYHTGDAGKPTVMIYNHYDVQPVDPLEEWTSPPFEPTVRDGEVYARGAQDNKGQCFYVLSAIRALIETTGTLPVNLKLCIEGEEEIGSPGLAGLLAARRDRLQADHLLIVDLGLHQAGKPAVTLGIRGLVSMTVEVTGSTCDLHSGSHGGIVINPLHALVKLLADLRAEDGSIAVPGFYDAVVPPTAAERSKLNFSFDEQDYGQKFGAASSGGEQSFSPLESAWLRPTLEINGLQGGYSGKGFKTVIPSRAVAKLSCRLVPEQDPLTIGRLVADYLQSRAPQGIEVRVEIHPGVGKAVRTSSESKVIRAVAQAYSEVLGGSCDFILEGASIPVVVELAAVSGAEIALMGYGLPGDRIHAPNEHFGLERIEHGFLTIARALQILGAG